MTIFLLTAGWLVVGILAFHLAWSSFTDDVSPSDVWHILAGPVLLLAVIAATILARNERKQDAGESE